MITRSPYNWRPAVTLAVFFCLFSVGLSQFVGHQLEQDAPAFVMFFLAGLFIFSFLFNSLKEVPREMTGEDVYRLDVRSYGGFRSGRWTWYDSSLFHKRGSARVRLTTK